MANDNNLYKAQNKLGTFYIVAHSFDEAVQILAARLDKADYGFPDYRKVSSIELLAAEHFFAGKQDFDADGGNLLIGAGGQTNGQKTGNEPPSDIMERLELVRRQELLSGFDDPDSLVEVEWIFDHLHTQDTYVNAYCIRTADLQDKLPMVDALTTRLPDGLKVLHKIGIRARSLKVGWCINGFRKGFRTQYIFETDRPSALWNTERIYRSADDSIIFILPSGNGRWLITSMQYGGRVQWAGTSVQVTCQGTHPLTEVECPDGGFDTMCAPDNTGGQEDAAL